MGVIHLSIRTFERVVAEAGYDPLVQSGDTMHVTILALGSRGDVMPYTTLGRALKAAGHRVRFVTFESFGPLVAAQGLDFHPIRGDAQGMLSGADEIIR